MIDKTRAPRSGGRAAAHRSGRRDFRTEGTAALATEGAAALAPEPAVTAAAPGPGSAAPTGDPGTGRGPGPHLRVAPPPPVSGPRAPFVALVLALVIGGVLGILVVNTKIAENSFRLDRLTRQQATLDVRQQQLEREIAAAEAPGSLRAAARKLGLVEAGQPAYIRLQDGKVIGVPTPAGGAPAVTAQGAGQ
jgi:hypothetical protein